MRIVTPQDELAFPLDPEAYVQAKAKLKALRHQGLHCSGIWGRTKTRRDSRSMTPRRG